MDFGGNNMKLNEFLETYPEEIDYDLYHKLDEIYGDEDMDEGEDGIREWAHILIKYEEEDR